MMYRQSKACAHVTTTPLDNLSKPVDQLTSCPQEGLSSGKRLPYQPGLTVVMHRPYSRYQVPNGQIRGALTLMALAAGLEK
jgi:hypothetical protein